MIEELDGGLVSAIERIAYGIRTRALGLAIARGLRHLPLSVRSLSHMPVMSSATMQL